MGDGNQGADILNGRYEILGSLGTGGMGVVYLARRLSLGDTVAIKQLHADLDSVVARRRFETEARAAAFIRHPNVVEVFDFGSLPDGRPYMVMEHLEGPTLAELIRTEGPLSVERTLEIFTPMCAAVEAGHRRGILHRDLKPANVILAHRDDGSEQVKVLDFGLACFSSSEPTGEPRATQPGTVMGTIEYMAPELVSGASASAGSDVWALGVMLYEMVVGRLPVEAPTPMALMYRIAMGTWTPPEEVRSDLPPGIISAIHAAAKTKPGDRPSSPELLARIAAPNEVRSRPAPAPKTGARVISEDAPTQESPTLQSARGRTAFDEPRFERFVGRAAEQVRLAQIVEKAAGGRGSMAVLRGATGVGKSALLDRLTSAPDSTSHLAPSVSGPACGSTKRSHASSG